MKLKKERWWWNTERTFSLCGEGHIVWKTGKTGKKPKQNVALQVTQEGVEELGAGGVGVGFSLTGGGNPVCKAILVMYRR